MFETFLLTIAICEAIDLGKIVKMSKSVKVSYYMIMAFLFIWTASELQTQFQMRIALSAMCFYASTKVARKIY